MGYCPLERSVTAQYREDTRGQSFMNPRGGLYIAPTDGGRRYTYG